MVDEDRKLQAEWIVAESVLGEVGTDDFSKDNYERWKNTGFFNGKDGNCRISFVTWERYFREKMKTIENMLSKEAQIQKGEREDSYEIFGVEGQVKSFYKKQPFFYDEARNFHLWDSEKGAYSMCDKVGMLNKLKKNIPHIDTINSKTKSEIITAFEQIGRNMKPKDMPKTWIQFKDKIVDIVSGEEFEATPEYYTTNPLPWKLGDSSDTPNIDKLLKEWVVDTDYQDKTYIKTMKQIIAYIICSDQFMQRLIALCGAGMNGKGTFIKMILKFIGLENSCSSDLKILATNNFEGAALFKKLLCVMGEVDAGDLKNTNTIKKLSGEDGMRYEFKGRGSFTEESPTTCLIATNSLPTTPDKSLGFYRRWLIIDFPHQFSIKRDLIGQIPDEEFENLGRSCLELLKEMYESNTFNNEGDLNKRMDKYEERSNPIMRFIETQCIEDSSQKVDVRVFCNAFNEYLKCKHLRVQKPKDIKKMLKEEGFDDSPRKILVGAETISVRFVMNLGLKTTETTETTDISTQNPPSKMTLDSCSSRSFCSSPQETEVLK